MPSIKMKKTLVTKSLSIVRIGFVYPPPVVPPWHPPPPHPPSPVSPVFPLGSGCGTPLEGELYDYNPFAQNNGKLPKFGDIIYL